MKREDGQLDWDRTAEAARRFKNQGALWYAIHAIQRALPAARDLDLHRPQAGGISREGTYCDEISVLRAEISRRRSA